MSLAVLVLAAGKGTRMNSDMPKVLHELNKKPLIGYVLEVSNELNAEKVVTVLGHDSDKIEKIIEAYSSDICYQTEQLGTGHAVMCAKSFLSDFDGEVLVLSGDVPAVKVSTLKPFINNHIENDYKVSVITTSLKTPKGYGRVERNNKGQVFNIVEEKDANSDQKEITEINSGIYCFNSEFLWNNIDKLTTNNKQKEYYLPGLIKLSYENGEKVGVYETSSYNEVLGINTRKELIFMQEKLNTEIIENLVKSGVSIIDPKTTYISKDVKIGKDTTIYPNTYLYGSTEIGERSIIGPSVYIEDSKVGSGVVIKFSSYITNAVIDNYVTMGPFCHIRPETHIKDKAKIGNFVEIKKSEIGEGSKVPHLSYVGDATLGKNVNVGAGTITCNYDGVNKHQTIVGDNVFIGSDTMLVAPVKVGSNASTAAGSTISKDVSDGALAIERSNQKEIAGWSERMKSRLKKK